MNESKIFTLQWAVDFLSSGSHILSLGGNSLHRVPHRFVQALAFRKDLRLHLVKTAGAYDIDLLCLAGMVDEVSAGFIGYETEFGMARHYRKEVEAGNTLAREHACYTVIAGLRASVYGLEFMPIQGLQGSDLVQARGWKRIPNPYNPPESYVAIPRIRPDLAVLHVQVADTLGNGYIEGPKNEDLLIARAARSVILTAEKVVEPGQLPISLDHVDIPSVLVTGVVEAPGGAWPGSCEPLYSHDPEGIRALQNLGSADELRTYLGRIFQ